LLPVTGILKRVASRRQELALQTFEVRGTFSMFDEPARAAAAALGLPISGQEISIPALLMVKTPGRCRLELLTADRATADRPAVVLKAGKLAGVKGLDRIPAAAALARGVCTLLGPRPADGDRAWAEALARAGVSLGEVHLGRFSGRVAYVVGARPADLRPQAWVDKQSFQPLRLVSSGSPGPELADVRLLDYGSPTGGDQFPRAVEVWEGKTLRARFSTETVAANPKIPDTLF